MRRLFVAARASAELSSRVDLEPRVCGRSLEMKRRTRELCPERFRCPITKLVMQKPVVASDGTKILEKIFTYEFIIYVTFIIGHTYERAAIERWFSAGRVS